MAWNDNRYKLIKQMQLKKPAILHLFDIENDLWEKKDISADHPDIVARMESELEAWRKSVINSDKGNDYPGGLPPKEKKEEE